LNIDISQGSVATYLLLYYLFGGIFKYEFFRKFTAEFRSEEF